MTMTKAEIKMTLNTKVLQKCRAAGFGYVCFDAFLIATKIKNLNL